MIGLCEVRCRETNISSPMALSASLMISVVNGSSPLEVVVWVLMGVLLSASGRRRW